MGIIGADFQPELYDVVRYAHNYGSQPLVGEEEALLTTFLSFVAGRGAVLIKAFSGTGKTVIMKAVLSLIPEGLLHSIELGSEKSPWYQADEITAAKYVEIPELQKASTNVDMVEILKAWGEEKAATRKRTDIITSQITGKDVTVPQVLPWRPFMTSVAMENRDAKIDSMEEFLRRVVQVHTDPSVAMTERVIDYKLKNWAVPGSLKTMDDRELGHLKMFTSRMIAGLESIERVANPAAGVLFRSIPKTFTISRSYVDYFRRMVDAIASFYRFHRLELPGGVLLATPQDVWMAWRIYGLKFVESCLKVPLLGREVMRLFPTLQEKLDGEYAPADDEMMTEGQVTSALKSLGYNLEKMNVRRLLWSLSQSGYLDVMEDSKPYKYFKSPFAVQMTRLNMEDVLREAERVVGEEYPEVEEQYGRFFMDKEVYEAMDPITGEKVDILHWEPDEEPEPEARKTAKPRKKSIDIGEYL